MLVGDNPEGMAGRILRGGFDPRVSFGPMFSAFSAEKKQKKQRHQAPNQPKEKRFSDG